jgi:hypothetical protein
MIKRKESSSQVPIYVCDKTNAVAASATMAWKSLEQTSRALIRRGRQVRHMLAALGRLQGTWRRKSWSIAQSVKNGISF